MEIGSTGNIGINDSAPGVYGSSTHLPSPQAGEALGKDAFLRLLVAQLEYQDPLNPMDNTEFVAQLAQFSTLEGINNLGAEMKNVSTDMSSLMRYGTTDFIGKQVTVEGDRFDFAGEPVELGYELGERAASVVVTIHDGTGKVIRTINADGGPSGKYMVTWDGRDNNGVIVQPGSYSFTVRAMDRKGDSFEATTYVSGMVTGVSFEEGVPYLVVGSMKVLPEDVVEIY